MTQASASSNPTAAAPAAGNMPLSHVRVLDLSRVLAGPWAAQNLADLGAEVIKVERPGTGDDTRAWGPPFLSDENGKLTNEAAYFMGINRGKRSITVDLSRPEGQELVRSLAERCDVIIENYKAGNLARYGLDYASICKVNPRIVYCSITGFGQDGPYRDRPAYDFLIQGMSGLMSVTGERADRPGGGPMKVGIPIADLMTGLYADVAILAALTHRDRTGQGQHIDLALLDVQISVMTGRSLGYFMTGEVPLANGNEHPNIVPQTVFPCRDGHLIIVVGNDSQFLSLCQAMGVPEMARDPRFATNPNRVINRDALNAMVIGHLSQRDRDYWVAQLEEKGVPCGPINNIKQTFDDPQVQHRQMQVQMQHPLGGSVSLVGNPIKYSATPITYRVAPPLLGQHTDAVLGGTLGLSKDSIDRLRQQKII